MGIQLQIENSPMVEMGAYSSLITSSIVGRVQILPEQILVVEDEEKRKSMIEKGLERASNFSWDKTVLETLKSIGVDL